MTKMSVYLYIQETVRCLSLHSVTQETEEAKHVFTDTVTDITLAL